MVPHWGQGNLPPQHYGSFELEGGEGGDTSYTISGPSVTGQSNLPPQYHDSFESEGGDTSYTISGPSVMGQGNLPSQYHDSFESEGGDTSYTISGPSVTTHWSEVGDTGITGDIWPWPGDDRQVDRQVQRSHSLQAHLQWQTQSLTAPPPPPLVQNPRPQLHPSYYRVLGGRAYADAIPPSTFDEAWPQSESSPPPNRDIPLDPVIYQNLPPSDLNVSDSRRDNIDDKKAHARLLDRSHPYDYRPQVPRPKPAGIDRAERARMGSNVTIIPWGKADLILQCQQEMKRRLFKVSLLPSKATIASLAVGAWDSIMQNQTRDDLRIWGTACSVPYQINKLTPVVEEIQVRLRDAIKIFACYEYDLLFDYTAAVSQLEVNMRKTQVQNLIANDAFLSAIQSVQGVNTSVPFSHRAVIAFASYVLYNSELQYHSYMGDEWNLEPLLTAITTFYRWALYERRTDLSHFSNV
ncbi:hypothetical protein P692DRAFT_201872809 [Suillus brevipes Sb2]|nr:hypothetical protein P692DRAFT_201872809 [Suillus brevipes Sb2]